MRNIEAGLRALIDTGDCQSHSAVEIYLKSGAVLYYATDQILVGATQYIDNLRQTGVVRHSRRRVVDSVEFEAQNIDSQLGLSLTSTAAVLDGARAKFRKIYVALDGTKHVRTLAQGQLATAVISELVVEAKLIGDLSTAGALAAWRALAAHCQWRFKDPRTCGAVTAATICTKRLTGANSCETHARRFRFSGFPFIEEDSRADRDPGDIAGDIPDIDDPTGRTRYSPFLNPYSSVRTQQSVY